MTHQTRNDNFSAVKRAVETYLEGLYTSDTAVLARVFHPKAIYACASEGELLHLGMEDYFKIVDKRPSPASPEPMNERILSIEFAGPVTAFVRLTCSIPPKDFIDLLTLIHVDGGWRIISKVFHFDLRKRNTA